jgi:hypothetical protein
MTPCSGQRFWRTWHSRLLSPEILDAPRTRATRYALPGHPRGGRRPLRRCSHGSMPSKRKPRRGSATPAGALQLIHHAEEIYETSDPRPLPPWLDWFSPVRLAGLKGNTLLTDRQSGPAKDTLQRALDQLPDDDSKQRSVFLGDLAAVAVAESNPGEACRLSELAIDQLERTWYATGMARVRAVRESLTPWETLPCVRQLDERLYDWNTQRTDELTRATIAGSSASVSMRQSTADCMSG